jgi:preprotein translocase subunit SecG
MLPSLQEQGFGDLPVQKPSADRIDGDSATDPKLHKKHMANFEQAQEQEYLTVSAQSKDVRKTTFLLAVLFAMGLLCLWFMAKKSTPQTAPAAVAQMEETQIETAIARLTGIRAEMFKGIERIVQKFYQFSDVQQVPVNELVKNPFRLEILLGDAQKIYHSEKRDLEIDPEMLKAQQLRQQTKNMQLFTIMQSEEGICCMINDKILYEGDSIRGFKVRQINDSYVKLEWDPKRDEERLGTQLEGVQILLKLSE